jgi:hypothetical protein
MEQVSRGPHVVESAVRWLVRKRKVLGQRAEFAVLHFLSDQPASQPARVDNSVGERRPIVRGECFVEESEIKPDIVANNHAVADKLPQ